MKPYDLVCALGALDDETVLDAREAPAKTVPLRRRFPRVALIAAVLTLLLGLSVLTAYAISHRNTANLMEEGPMTNGRVKPEIDEAGMQIIDTSAVDLGLSQTSNGTTITLESAMGFTDPKESLIYLTFTITPPEGYEFPDDMTHWCFFDNRQTLVPDDLLFVYACSTVKNPDGTASVLWVVMPFGDPIGHRMHIEIDGFGTADKEVVASVYDGSRQIELPGSWIFDFELPALPGTREFSLDAAALQEAGLPVTALRLSSFGGILELSPQALTEGYHPKTFTVEYTDKPDYTVISGEIGENLWINCDDNGTPFCLVLFLNPQQLQEAQAVVIDGVRIPLT